MRELSGIEGEEGTKGGGTEMRLFFDVQMQQKTDGGIEWLMCAARPIDGVGRHGVYSVQWRYYRGNGE